MYCTMWIDCHKTCNISQVAFTYLASSRCLLIVPPASFGFPEWGRISVCVCAGGGGGHH